MIEKSTNAQYEMYDKIKQKQYLISNQRFNKKSGKEENYVRKQVGNSVEWSPP